MPAFDITPEMMTHTVVVDPGTMKPLPTEIGEQFDWVSLPDDDEKPIIDYFTKACHILNEVGLTPTGVTSPGYFGGIRCRFMPIASVKPFDRSAKQRRRSFSPGALAVARLNRPSGISIKHREQLLER